MSPETPSRQLSQRVAKAQAADVAARDNLAAAIAAYPHGEKEAQRLLTAAGRRSAAALALREAIRATRPQPCDPALPCDFNVEYSTR